MREFIKEVLTMPYYKNYSAESGAVHNISKHEEAVEDLLLKHGYVPANLPTRGKSSPISIEDRDAAKLDPSNVLLGIPNNSYVSQPCGTHASPDFIVNSNGRLYFYECKSSKQTHPTYNGGCPDPHYVYIFSSEKTDETTVFMGSDIVTLEQRGIIEQINKEIQSILDRENARLVEADCLNRGIDYYNRAMYCQKGKGKKDYFQHENRFQCEEGVLSHVS